jgi:hypothetical protein
MDIKYLARQLQEMRSLQKQYFATRSRSVLEQSKAKEKEIDDLTSRILASSLASGPSPSDFGPFLADELCQFDLFLDQHKMSFEEFVAGHIIEALKSIEQQTA